MKTRTETNGRGNKAKPDEALVDRWLAGETFASIAASRGVSYQRIQTLVARSPRYRRLRDRRNRAAVAARKKATRDSRPECVRATCSKLVSGPDAMYCSRKCHALDSRDAAAGRRRQAYHLRKGETNWSCVAETLGYASGVAACMAAKRHARRYKLTWPPLPPRTYVRS